MKEEKKTQTFAFIIHFCWNGVAVEINKNEIKWTKK